jgi:hypothetical protein
MTLADDFTSFSVFFDYYVTLYVSTVELEGHLRCFGTVSEMLLNMVMFSFACTLSTAVPSQIETHIRIAFHTIGC